MSLSAEQMQTLAEWQARAVENGEPDVVKYIINTGQRNVFFLDERGQRCVYREGEFVQDFFVIWKLSANRSPPI
jgi:hypothetical protein